MQPSILNPRRTVACLLAAMLLGLSVPGLSIADDKPEKIGHRELTKTIRGLSGDVHYGDLSVAKRDTIVGDFAVIEGSLDLASGSLVKGTVWIVNGDLILSGRARLDGSVHLVNGALFQSLESEISGTIRYYKCECRLSTDLYESSQRVVFVKFTEPDALGPHLAIKPGTINRADFTSLQIGVARGDPNYLRPHWQGHALALLPLRDNARGYLGFDAGVSMPISGRHYELTVDAFKKTVTNDAWQYSTAENSAALLLTHNDLHDYYERTGVSIGLKARPLPWLTLGAGVYTDDSRSLVAKTVPSLANNGRPLRDIPPVDEGGILGGVLSATLDTRILPENPASAWYAHAEIESGLDAGPGDFDFTTLTFDLRRYNRIFGGINVDFRGRIFTAMSQVPRQRQQSLNGYSGVRGLHDIPFSMRRGDRLALFSTELSVPMPEAPILKYLYTDWNVMAFADLGLLALYQTGEGTLDFLDTPWDAWGKSVGIGLSGESFVPYLGFYVAQDLDRHNKRPRFIVRVARPF